LTRGYASGTADIQNSTFEYSGTDGLYFTDTAGTIQSSTIRHNTVSNMYGLKVISGNLTVSGNTFQSNKNGLLAANGPHTISENQFLGNSGSAISFSNTGNAGTPTFSNNSASGNGVNGIEIGDLVDSYTFSGSLPYVKQNVNTTLVPSGKTFSADPGVIFKLDGVLWNIAGTLNVNGTSENPVIFTSFKDDTYGGDTNSDGTCDPGNASSTASCPAPGDWNSLFFNATSHGTFSNAIIRYGARCSLCGTGPSAAIKADGVALSISNSTIEKNKNHGLWLLNSATSTITHTTFRDHLLGFGAAESLGLLLNSARAILDNVSFINNFKGIVGDSNSSVEVGSGGVNFSGNTTDDSPATLVP